MRIIPYRKVSELDVLLRSFLAEADREQTLYKFIVPSRRDREWWQVRAGARDFGLDAQPSAHLWNWEDLYNNLCSFLEVPGLKQIDPPDHRLILSYIVADFLKDRESKKLLELWPGLARPGFIDILSDDIRELINEAVSVEQLSATVAGDKPTSVVLTRLYERYLAYLGGNRLLDSAQIPLKALELLGSEAAKNWARTKTFVFAGFMSFTHGQIALLRRLEEFSLEGVVVLKPATELKNFQDATRQLEGVTWEENPPLTSGVIVSLSASDVSGEPEAVARSLALWRAGEGNFAPLLPFPGFGAVGMSVPEQHLAAMESALRRYRIPYSLARGRSIGRTPPGAVLDSLWGVWVQGLEPYETALLLAHPCLAGADFSVDAAARFGPRGVKGWEFYLDYLERGEGGDKGEKEAAPPRPEEPGGQKKKSQSHRSAARMSKAFRAMTRFCRTLDKGASPVGLFKALHSFLTTPGLWADALSDFSLNSPAMDESLRELNSSVAEVRAKYLALRELKPDLGPAGAIVLKGGEAVDFLKSWCEDTLVHPSPLLCGALTLYTGAPPILASCSAWILTDATQKNWPGAVRSSPLLDAPEREAMAGVSAYLPSAHDKHVQREALFRRLLQTGEELTVISHSATDEEGRPASVTPFVRSFCEDMRGNWNYIASSEDLTGRPAKYFPDIEPGGAEKIRRAPPALQGREEKLRLPVSDLFELLDCPLRYRLKRGLKLKERRVALFSEAEAGQLTHNIWEAVWRRRQSLEDREDAGANSLPSLAANEWGKALSLSEEYLPFERLLKDRRLERHRRNIGFYIGRLADVQQEISDRLAARGIRHEAVKVEAELVPFEVDGVVFTGRCDRLEILSGGGLNGTGVVIADYKWGRGVSYEKKCGTFQYGLQLSAYALMYEAGHPDQPVLGVGFLGHRDGAVAGSFAPPVAACYMPDKKKPSLMKERTDEAQEAMKLAAGLLKNRRYEPRYSANSCRYCDVRGVCRKGEFRGEFLSRPDGDDADDPAE